MSSQYLSSNGFVLNRTSGKIRQHVQRTFGLNNSHPGGIVPFIPTFDNWTRVEAIQQGITAEVNCTQTPASDPYIHITQTAVTPEIREVFFCCNCTSEYRVEPIGGEGWPFLVLIFTFYRNVYQDFCRLLSIGAVLFSFLLSAR